MEQIHSSLLIQDHEGALRHSKAYYLENPDSLERKFIYAETLAHLLYTQEALNLVRQEDLTPKNAFALIESLAWSVLRKHARGGESSEAMSLLGSALTRDIRGLKIVLEKGRSTNAKIRGFALRLAAYYPDPPMKKLVARLVDTETNYHVRLEAIRAAGQQGNQEAVEPLKRVLENPLSTAEERLCVIRSLAAILERLDTMQIDYLLQNGRAQYRELALEAIIREGKREYLERVKGALVDPSLDVRYKAFEALALLAEDPKEIIESKEAIQKSCQESSLPLTMMAHWLLSLTREKDSIQFLLNQLKHESETIRVLAASYIAKSKPILEWIDQHGVLVTDPYVKINLAIGLLRHRLALEFVKESFREFLHQETHLVMTNQEESLFPVVTLSKVKHQAMIPNYPLVVDQLTRLSLIGSYALVDLEGAKKSLAQLLEKRLVPVSKMALMFLFKESDTDVVAVARELMQNADKKNRLQLLLVLAFFGKEVSVREELIQLYPEVSFEEKLQIVESLGYLGGDEAIHFLMGKIEESSRLIQIAAASSLIQSLYH